MSFAEVVRFHRLRLGLTQEELGGRLGRDATRISRVEQGHTYRRLPDAAEFLAWATALNTPPEVMLSQMGYMGEVAVSDAMRRPDLVFMSLAEEIRTSETMPSDVQSAALDGLRHAQRIWELQHTRRE